jgi:uncharacterized cupin superfamily protein
MSDTPPTVVNVDEVDAKEHNVGDHYGAVFKPLTPSMRPRGGRLGVNQMRLRPGRTTCPFHYHQLEDEVFYVLSGRGVLRYGDEVRELRAGDCVSCPAGVQTAHQIANPFDEDLVYLAIGPYEEQEVAVYPDAGKVLIRGIGRIGVLDDADYFAGEPQPPKIFELARKLTGE